MRQIEMPLASFMLFLFSLLVLLLGMVGSGFRVAALNEENAKCIGYIDGMTNEREARVMELDSMIAHLKREYVR